MRARATSPFRGAKRNEGGAHGAQRNARGMPAEAGLPVDPYHTTPTRKPKPQTTTNKIHAIQQSAQPAVQTTRRGGHPSITYHPNTLTNA